MAAQEQFAIPAMVLKRKDVGEAPRRGESAGFSKLQARTQRRRLAMAVQALQKTFGSQPVDMLEGCSALLQSRVFKKAIPGGLPSLLRSLPGVATMLNGFDALHATATASERRRLMSLLTAFSFTDARRLVSTNVVSETFQRARQHARVHGPGTLLEKKARVAEEEYRMMDRALLVMSEPTGEFVRVTNVQLARMDVDKHNAMSVPVNVFRERPDEDPFVARVERRRLTDSLARCYAKYVAMCAAERTPPVGKSTFTASRDKRVYFLNDPKAEDEEEVDDDDDDDDELRGLGRVL